MLSVRDFLQEDKAVVCALVVFMNPDGFSPLELKLACYRKLVNYHPNLTQKKLNDIVHALETYVKLSDAEQQEFQRLILEVYPEVSQMITNPWIERGIQRGIQQGIQQGEQRGTIRAKQETLMDLMQLRFGPLPQSLMQRIQSIQEIDQLNVFLRRVITTTRLEEMGIQDGSGPKQEQ